MRDNMKIKSVNFQLVNNQCWIIFVSAPLLRKSLKINGGNTYGHAVSFWDMLKQRCW